MDSKKFDARYYANDFEKLSLEIVEIIYFSGTYKHNIIEKEHTQATRDNGVDGYIKFNVNDTIITYTVEAKLRTTKTLGLKDFASSILYSLINFSTKHFVVTNIVYSDEAVRVINSLNSQKNSNIDLIDGRKLQSIINQQLNLIYNYPGELINFIRNWDYSGILPIDSKLPQSHLPETFIITPHLKCQIENFFYDCEIENRLFIIEGSTGTGKTAFIKYTTPKLAAMYSAEVFYLDMELITAPPVFCLEIVRIFLGVDLLHLLEFLSETDKKEILETYLTNSNNLDEISLALQILFKGEISGESNVYFMHKLIEKIILNWKNQRQIILVFINLDKASRNIIFFLLHTLKVLTQYGIFIFIEFLIPHYQKQIPQNSLSEWFDIRELFTNFKYGAHIAQTILMNNYTTAEQNYILLNTLKTKISDQYCSVVRQYLGNNPEMFYLGIKKIIQHKLYSIPLIKNYKKYFVNKEAFYINTYREYTLNKENIDALKYALSVSSLLEGLVPEFILKNYSEEFDLKTFLICTPFFILDNHTIRVSSKSIYQIPGLLSSNIVVKAGLYIIENIDNIFIRKIDKYYFSCHLDINIKERLCERKIKDCITLLKKENQFLRIENILYSIYVIMKHRTYESSEIFLILLEYLNFVSDQYNFLNEEIASLILETELLYEEMQLSSINREEKVILFLKYYKYKYKKAKMCYNFEECWYYTDMILQYENEFPEYQIFYIMAHEWKSLNFKEYGYYKKAVNEYVYAIKRYPDSKPLKISFWMNVAAYYYFSNIRRAEYILEKNINFVEASGSHYLNYLWMYHDLLMLGMYQGRFDMNKLYTLRKGAEVKNAANVLARNFNMEGYYNFYQQNFYESKECFQTAVNICIQAGKNKPYFLFLANLITVKLKLGESIDTELSAAMNWMCQHSKIIKERLNRTKSIGTEHIFAALVSYLISSLSSISLKKQVITLINDRCFVLNFNNIDDLIKKVSPYYCLSNSILILF